MSSCKQSREPMDLVRIIEVNMPICICHVATASPVQDEYPCRMPIGMVIALEVRRLFSPLVHLLVNP